jgi:hypothetical protein
VTAILRPKFSEGQVLGAADLNAQVDYDRQAMLLHERTAHLWGVVQGLALVPGTPSGGSVPISLQPGRAIDRFGRSIVVTAAIPLDPTDFQLTSTSKNQLFPVFVQAVETSQAGSTQPGKCSTTAITRIVEGVQISFGTTGSEIQIDEQQPAGVGDPLTAATSDDKVLVGWVAVDPTSKLFVKASATSSTGQGIRYAGVVASDVVALGGTLSLHTRATGTRYAVTVKETSTGGCELRFGKQDGDGAVTPTFTVDDQGNVSYAGALHPLPAAKTVAESGVAYDGVCLPLPAGVTPAQVTSGAIRIHVVLTPIPQAPQKFGGKPYLPIVTKCAVDMTGDRRLRCTVTWVDPTAPGTTVDLAGTCNYLLVASGA